MAENDHQKLASLIEYSEKYQDDSYEYRCVRASARLCRATPCPRGAHAGAATRTARPPQSPASCTPFPPPSSLPCSHARRPLETRPPPPSPPPSHAPFAPRSHVILPKELAKTLQPKRLLAENEWRALGVQQSRGWVHYAIHRCVPLPPPSPPPLPITAPPPCRQPLLFRRTRLPFWQPKAHAQLLPYPNRPLLNSPEPHILLFRRELGTDPVTGKVRGHAAKTPPPPCAFPSLPIPFAVTAALTHTHPLSHSLPTGQPRAARAGD